MVFLIYILAVLICKAQYNRRTTASNVLPPKTRDEQSSVDESDDLTETRLLGYSRDTGSSTSLWSEPNQPLVLAETLPTTEVDISITGVRDSSLFIAWG